MKPGAEAVLVTGGGSGIGAAVATALLQAGSKVVIAGRRLEPLTSVVARYPGRGFAIRCDLTVAAERDRLPARAHSAMGKLDGVVHSAGLAVHQPFSELDEATLRAQLEVNLIAPLLLSQAALPALDDGGAMVFLSSTLAHRPVATSAAYSAAKAGLLAFSRVLALEGAPRRLRVNVVSPGVVDTEMIRAPRPGVAPGAAGTDALLASLQALHPLGRLGTAEEVAAAVLFLLQAPWTTGTELTIDGGLLVRS